VLLVVARDRKHQLGFGEPDIADLTWLTFGVLA
jgi:hypothetical protein